MSTTTPETVRLPVTYRTEIVAPIMRRLQAGESCAVVGAAGSGKSNLVSVLARRDVQTHYLGAAQADFLFVHVDFNRLADSSEWGFWELLLHRLVTALPADGIDTALFARLSALHEQAALSRDAVVAQRSFETAVSQLSQTATLHLPFLFDQFDEVWRSVAGGVFRVLRALRDEFKYRLCYVVFTRDELSRLRRDLREVEDFYELVAPHTYGLGPHSEADARNQVARFDLRRGAALPECQVAQLLRISGRHPGLLRAAYWALAGSYVADEAGLADHLAADEGVRQTCAEIWRSLDDEERALLRSAAHGRPLKEEDRNLVRLLQLKGLLDQDHGNIVSQLFSIYIRNASRSSPHRLSYDPVSKRLEVDGRPPAEELTSGEMLLFEHLYLHRGQVCSRSDLLQVLHPEEAISDEELNARRLDTQVRRLRDKIEPDRDHPQFIITVRSRGYKLAIDPVSDSLS